MRDLVLKYNLPASDNTLIVKMGELFSKRSLRYYEKIINPIIEDGVIDGRDLDQDIRPRLEKEHYLELAYNLFKTSTDLKNKLQEDCHSPKTMIGIMSGIVGEAIITEPEIVQAIGIQDAIALMSVGYKVTHNSWLPDDYIYMENNKILNDGGNQANIRINELESYEWKTWSENDN